MKGSEKNNAGNHASEFLCGDLMVTYLKDTELETITGGADLVPNGTVQRQTGTILCDWHNCTVRISGCKKLTT